MKPVVFLLLTLSLIAFSCKKKDKYKDIPDQYKAYFLFSENSSWVYFNNNIHGNDSIVLRDITGVETKPDNVCSKYRFEYKLQFTSVTTGKIFHSQTFCIDNTEISDGFSSVLLTAPPTSLTFIIDTLWVNGHRFNSVLAYQDTTPNHKVFVAYASGIGRIKSFEMLNGDTLANYEIVRYHVSPY